MAELPTLEELRAGLDDWRSGSLECVPRLAHALGLEDPDIAAQRPYVLAGPLHDLLRAEDLDSLPDDDFNWLQSHVIAFTAHYISDTHGGQWIVDDDPTSPTYRTYVLGDFPSPVEHGFTLDVGKPVVNFFRLPVGRSYTDLIGDLVERIPGIQHFDFSS